MPARCHVLEKVIFLEADEELRPIHEVRCEEFSHQEIVRTHGGPIRWLDGVDSGIDKLGCMVGPEIGHLTFRSTTGGGRRGGGACARPLIHQRVEVRIVHTLQVRRHLFDERKLVSIPQFRYQGELHENVTFPDLAENRRSIGAVPNPFQYDLGFYLGPGTEHLVDLLVA